MENILKKPCKSDTHVSSVHEGKKTLRCEMCGKTCFNMARLTEHIAAIHEGKKPFRCDICDYRCSQKNDMIRHVALVHEGKKLFRYECIFKCEPTGGKLKWGTIIPLIGGSSIGCSKSAGNLPAFHLSYTPFKNNEAHLERYWPKVPKYYIDQDQEPENMKGVDYINTCAGLSMLNRSKGAGVGDGSDAKMNKWMFKSTEYVLEKIKPKVMWGENAHSLFTPT